MLSPGVVSGMRTIETTIDIDATPETVWQALVDFESYADWNPFITEAAGSAVVGGRLRIHIQPPDGRGATFKPAVTVADPGERLEWLGKLGVRGLFDGRHAFHLEATDDGHTRLTQREAFSGLLVGLLLDEEAIENGFEAMDEALKMRVESGVSDVGDAGDEPLAA